MTKQKNKAAKKIIVYLFFLAALTTPLSLEATEKEFGAHLDFAYSITSVNPLGDGDPSILPWPYFLYGGGVTYGVSDSLTLEYLFRFSLKSDVLYKNVIYNDRLGEIYENFQQYSSALNVRYDYLTGHNYTFHLKFGFGLNLTSYSNREFYKGDKNYNLNINDEYMREYCVVSGIGVSYRIWDSFLITFIPELRYYITDRFSWDFILPLNFGVLMYF